MIAASFFLLPVDNSWLDMMMFLFVSVVDDALAVDVIVLAVVVGCKNSDK